MAVIGFEDAFVVSFDHLSPHIFEVAFEPSIQDKSPAISSALGVILPYNSPTLKTSCPRSLPGWPPRFTWPASQSPTVIPDITQPISLSKPTIEARVKSFIQFWLLTSTPLLANRFFAKWAAHTVSYDFIAKNMMSYLSLSWEASEK
jgi:hypothetical protein